MINFQISDNVHFQNTLQFIRTLEEQNIHFQLMVSFDYFLVFFQAFFEDYFQPDF